MRIRISTFCALLFLFVIGVRADAQSLIPPSGNILLLNTFAEGVQIYASAEDAANPDQFVWAFQAPRADLFDGPAKQTQLGIHYVGPTWEANDGSTVVAMRVAGAPSSHPDSIPQLLLQGISHTGSGLFSEVTFIQRLDTVGGLAPGARPTELGQQFEAPYTATYNFYVAAPVPEPGSVALLIGLAVPGALLLRRRSVRRS